MGDRAAPQGMVFDFAWMAPRRSRDPAAGNPESIRSPTKGVVPGWPEGQDIRRVEREGHRAPEDSCEEETPAVTRQEDRPLPSLVVARQGPAGPRGARHRVLDDHLVTTPADADVGG